MAKRKAAPEAAVEEVEATDEGTLTPATPDDTHTFVTNVGVEDPDPRDDR